VSVDMSEGDPITKILRKDRRYRREAYDFVQEALRSAHERSGTRRHVTGKELLAAFRELAKSEFGPLSRTVLAEWGLRATEDVGNVVFNLVEAEELGKTDEDDLADFRDVFDFDSAFPPEAGSVRMRRRSEEE